MLTYSLACSFKKFDDGILAMIDLESLHRIIVPYMT